MWIAILAVVIQVTCFFTRMLYYNTKSIIEITTVSKTAGGHVNKYKYIFFLLIFLLLPSIALAASHYIRAGAGGSSDGSDWANAWTDIPSTLTRGDTYYLADGTYARYTVNDAASGTSIITIKKATVAEHGTDTGWNDSFGDGQAIFSDSGGLTGIINIVTSYITFDGAVGSGSDPNSYGFKIATPTNCNQTNEMLGVPGVGNSNKILSNVSISHVSMTNCGDAYKAGGAQEGIYSNPQSGSNLTITYSYFSDNATNITIHKWAGVEISNNYFNSNWSDPAYTHGQQVSTDGSSNITIKNNTFKDSTTLVLGLHANSGTNTGISVHSNLVIGPTTRQLSGCFTAVSGITNTLLRGEFHHNTFVDVNCGGRGAVFVGNITDVANDKSYAYNNLFYNVVNPRMDNSGFTTGAIVYSHSAHFDSSGTYDNNEGGTTQNGSGDPFVDSANGNYALKVPTSPGLALGSPFNVDFEGDTIGEDGVWDRGAIEYEMVAPNPPTPD